MTPLIRMLLLLLLPGAALAADLTPTHRQAEEDDDVEAKKAALKSLKPVTALDPVAAARAAAGVDPRATDDGGGTAPADDGGKGGAADEGGGDAGDDGKPWTGDADVTVDTKADGAANPRKSPVQPLPGDVRINIEYDNVEIKDIIKDFSRKTGRNFLIDPKISGKITVLAPLAVPIGDAYDVFIAILDANGFATVVEATYGSDDPDWKKLGLSKARWKKGDPLITRILPANDAKSEPLRLYKGGSMPSTAALVTRLVQLDNISADDVSKVIQKWVSGAGDVVSYAPTNTLILTDSANNIRRLMDLIQELDVSAPKQKLEVITIKYAEATRVVEIIREIYGEDGDTKAAPKAASSSKSRRRSRSKAAAPSTASATSVGSETSFIGKMIADERTNSIIVLATDKSLEDIKGLIARIDYQTDPFAQSDIHVIYLEHAKAEELAQTLNNLIQQTNQRAQQSRTNSSSSSRTRNQPAPAATEDENGNFQGEVRLTHDVATNALVVTAARQDYDRLRRVVELLDIPRKQVFVETVIMEVSDQRVNDNGVSWHGGGGGANQLGPVSILGARGSSSITPAASLLDGSLLAGLGLGVFGQAINIPVPGVDGGLEIPAFGIVLRFLQEDTNTNVLSSPNILTLDNEEASIEIGEKVPFPTGGLGSLAGAAGAAGISGLAGLTSVSFTREDVGIILRITPQINESDFVTMEVYQEISEVKEGSTNDASNGGPITTKRSAETSVSVRSNQTVVIGGLMQEVDTESETKVPVLGDIPILGALFRNKRKTKRKTNLLIFLTPHVIDGPEDLYEVYRIKMLQRQEFMRRFYGKTAEEQLNELNELIRFSMNLPDEPSVYREKEARPREVQVTMPEDVRGALGTVESGGAVLITPDGEMEIPQEPEEEEPGDDQPEPEFDAPDEGEGE